LVIWSLLLNFNIDPMTRCRGTMPALAVIILTIVAASCTPPAQQTDTASPGASPAEPHTAETRVAADLARLAEQLARADQFSGVVLLKRHGRVIFERAYGLADRDAARPNTAETPFALASVGKMFTAVLVAQLVEQDKVRLGSTIGSLLPNFPAGQTKSQVTVHQLLTMSSGIPDVFRLPQFWMTLAGARTLSDLWPVFATRPLEFTPGDRWAYSNSNFLVLGAIVEQGFGEAFTTAAERRVFQRAGLTHTSYRAAVSLRPARGYTHVRPATPAGSQPDPGRWYPAWDEDAGEADPVAAPMGGGYSTAGDLVRFADALTGNQLLSRPMTERVMNGYVPADYGGREGYGFETRVVNRIRILGHQGATAGVSNQFDFYPDLGYVLVVLGNSDGSGTQEIAKHVRSVLTAPSP
jgi:CubicO group peptidase (beta-lactamase class C family)